MNKEFTKKDLHPTDINSGQELTEEYAVKPTDLNALISGVLNNTDKLTNHVMSKEDCTNMFAKSNDVYTKSESNEKFVQYVDVYPKTVSDSLFALKAESYSKYNIDEKFATKDAVYDKDTIANTFSSKSESDKKYAKLDNTYTKSDINDKFINTVDLNSAQVIYGKKTFQTLNIGADQMHFETLEAQQFSGFINVLSSKNNNVFFFELYQSKLFLIKYDKAKDAKTKYLLPKTMDSGIPVQILTDRKTGDVYAIYLQMTLHVGSFCTIAVLKRDSDNLIIKDLPQDFSFIPFDIDDNKIYCVNDSKMHAIDCSTLLPITDSNSSNGYI